MHTTSAREDYLKAMYSLTAGGRTTNNSELVRRLAVSSPSVSAMVKRLQLDGLIERAGTRGLRLSPAGERVAVDVVRRQRLIETFLVEMLDVPWEQVQDEAELLEHAVSDRLADRIDAALGHPSHDPHGDPIPARDGVNDESWGTRLDAVAPGGTFAIERIRTEFDTGSGDAAALRHLAAIGAVPGAEVEVLHREPFGGALHVRIAGVERALGPVLVELIYGRHDDVASPTSLQLAMSR